MAIALRKRLVDKKIEILEYTKLYGRWRAMDKFNIADTLAFGRLLQEWTNDENYGCNPQIKLDTHKTMGEQLLEAIHNKISELEAKIQRQNEIIEIYRLKEDKEQQELKVIDDCDRLLKLCEIKEVQSSTIRV